MKPADYARIGEVAVKSIFARANPRPLTTAQEVVALLEIIPEAGVASAVQAGA